MPGVIHRGIAISIASIPIKCMVQMPMPIAIPPPISKTRADFPLLVDPVPPY